MKLTQFTTLLALGIILTIAASGCRKKPTGLTPLPGYAQTQNPSDIGPGAAIGEQSNLDQTLSNLGDTPLPDPSLRQNWQRDAEVFKTDTVHFNFDSSAVRSLDEAKIAAVADYLKANMQDAVEIDGHCDERGTEEYNRSLGERRALALREALVRLGIDPMRIDTVSYGKDRPVDPGHNEAAWKQNRRGEFLLEVHPQ